MKIITVVGARPQFIKASLVSKNIAMHDNLEEVIVHTGQHFDQNMSEIFFKEMGIPSPKYNLGIHSLKHGAMTGRQLEQIEKILIKESPDILLVYGDTNSTLAGALAASKMDIPIAHIEAGLRSYNRKMPEEINRLIVDHVSEFLFVPCESSIDNLIKEGVSKSKIYHSGDVMYDSVRYFGKLADEKSNILDTINLRNKEYILATVHRQENTISKKRMENIFSALSSIPDFVIMPIHPRTKKIIDDYEIKIGKNILIIDPVGYLDMIMLQKNASKIATDSGGLQKEAFFNKIPCITLRDETEWKELLKDGANIIAGSDKNLIVKHLMRQKTKIKFNQIYGNGTASKKIVSTLLNHA